MSAKVAKTTVPSVNDVLVPETLLKKRRDDAKSREEKQAKTLEARKVSINFMITKRKYGKCSREIDG